MRNMTANAIHAARDRLRTSEAVTIATPIDAAKYVAVRCARSAARKQIGNPNAAMCATKLRLPSVPPGTRDAAKSSRRSPYACSSDVIAAITTARARPLSNGRSSPASRNRRAVQNSTMPDALTARARIASQRFVANAVDTALRSRYAVSSQSTRVNAMRCIDRSARSPAITAVR